MGQLELYYIQLDMIIRFILDTGYCGRHLKLLGVKHCKLSRKTHSLNRTV